jgi:HPt (histidine-containing phosphotransfer) domain-containing protein
MAAADTIDLAVTQDIKGLMSAEQWQGMLAQLFAAEQGDVAQLLHGLARPDRHALGDQAHKVKGGCAVLGLVALRDVATRIESLARAAPHTPALLPQASAHAAALQQASERTQAALANLG